MDPNIPKADQAPSPETQNVKVVPDIPVFFADGVLSHAYAPGISKFYFYRTNSDPLLALPNRNVVVAQCIMQAEGFARTVHFFNYRLKLMVRDGAISQEAVDRIFAFSYDEPTNPNG